MANRLALTFLRAAVAQTNETLCKIPAHNLCILI